jgi:hypothetical protein
LIYTLGKDIYLTGYIQPTALPVDLWPGNSICLWTNN